MLGIFSRYLSLAAACLALASSLAAQGQESAPLVVGVTPSPPFSYEQDGEWVGISLDLWRGAAEELGYDYELRPVQLGELLEGLESGEIDVAAAALVATAERDKVMDFSHTFYTGGLSVATPYTQRSMVLGFLRQLVQIETLLAIGALLLLLAAVGLVIWLVERKRNPEQFGGDSLEGLGNGFWWSAVTMTTVGYGDKAPISLPGRIVGLIWMFASIILISGFTGAIASALTVSGLSPQIESMGDLYSARVGTVANSEAASFLDRAGIGYRSFPGTAQGLAAVAAGDLDGFVNDGPVLRYYVRSQFNDALTVLNQSFDTGYYAIGLRQDSPIQEALNIAVLERIQSDDWSRVLQRHMGPR